MKQPFQDRMSDATRLVRSGQIAQATALLRGTPLPVATGERRSEPAPEHPDGAVSATPEIVSGGGGFGLPPGGFVDGLLADMRQALRGLQPRERPHVDPAAPANEATGPASGAFTEARFSNATGSRPYKLYVPAGADASSPLPLIVMLHGCTQSPDDFAAGTRMNALADRDRFLVCYPAQTAAANGSRCWNWFNDGDQHRDRGEPSLIAGITREVMRHHAVDPARVYVAGLSAGGALAATMGRAYPDLYAAVGVHSGLACGAAHDAASAFMAMRQGGGTRATRRDAAGIPTIVFHGDRDSTVNPVNGDEVAAQSVDSSAITTEVEDGTVPGGHGFRRARYRDASGTVLAEQWTVHGAGHAWAGGSPAGSYTDPQGPDASGEMVRFFLQHPGAGAPAPALRD